MSGETDYRDLLKRYMSKVMEAEGVAFTGHGAQARCLDTTPEQVAELDAIAEEASAEARAEWATHRI